MGLERPTGISSELSAVVFLSATESFHFKYHSSQIYKFHPTKHYKAPLGDTSNNKLSQNKLIMFNCKGHAVAILSVLSLVASVRAYETQPMAGQNQEATDQIGERVDKLASAAGDLYLHRSIPEVRIIGGSRAEMDPISMIVEYPIDSNNYAALRNLNGPVILEEGPTLSRNYHALIDDFKQSYLSSNPSREGRAFKPKLMSTARGFGKRALGGRFSRDFLESIGIVSQNRPFFINGKTLKSDSTR